jgi:hypothetical protein
MSHFSVTPICQDYREVKMDPHDIEAAAAINQIKEFYGSVDSILKRKKFRQQKVCVVGESKNERDRDLVSAGYHEAELEI